MKLAKIAKFDSLIELLDAFPDEESCIIYLEHLRWPNKVKSPFDKKSKVYHLGNHRYMCKNTQKIFNVKVGTIFHSTKLPLRKWFMAIWLVLSHKKRYIVIAIITRFENNSKNCMVYIAEDKNLSYL